MRDHLGPYRIQHHIVTELQDMRVLLNENSRESPLKEMSRPLMPAVICLRVATVQLVHAKRQIRLWRFNQEMIVIVHHTIGVTEPAITLNDLSDPRQKLGAIAIALDDVLPGMAATGDEVERVGKFLRRGFAMATQSPHDPIALQDLFWTSL
jgi:hypothetical protein